MNFGKSVKIKFLQSNGRTIHTPPHISVMPNEVLKMFDTPQIQNGIILDCTFGAGGHTSMFLEKTNSRVYAIDRDKSVFDLNAPLIQSQKDRLVPMYGKFSEMESLLKSNNITKVDGILMDIGVSSMQLDSQERGFSFMRDAPLDMRMDSTNKLTAADVVNKYSEKDLSNIFWQYGEDMFSARIAHAIGNARRKEPILTTLQLTNIIESVRPKGKTKFLKTQNPSTKVFQALRVYINEELRELAVALRSTERLLNPGGRLAIIAFQPYEDKVIKEYLFSCANPKKYRGIHLSDTDVITHTNKESANAIKPSFHFITQLETPKEDELTGNPRSRSAKLRCVERTQSPVIDFPLDINTWMIDWKKYDVRKS